MNLFPNDAAKYFRLLSSSWFDCVGTGGGGCVSVGCAGDHSDSRDETITTQIGIKISNSDKVNINRSQ